MDYTLQQRDRHCQLKLDGTFTFGDNSKFRQILNTLRETTASDVTMDLSGLKFIDSAALGMLLLLHDEAGKKGLKITLAGATGQIRKMLQLSNFEQIFTIRDA